MIRLKIQHNSLSLTTSSRSITQSLPYESTTYACSSLKLDFLFLTFNGLLFQPLLPGPFLPLFSRFATLQRHCHYHYIYLSLTHWIFSFIYFFLLLFFVFFFSLAGLPLSLFPHTSPSRYYSNILLILEYLHLFPSFTSNDSNTSLRPRAPSTHFLCIWLSYEIEIDIHHATLCVRLCV